MKGFPLNFACVKEACRKTSLSLQTARMTWFVCRKEFEAVQNYLTLAYMFWENLTPEAEFESGYLYAGQS